MIEEALSLRYARALLDVARTHNAIDAICRQIKLFLDILDKQPKLEAVLSHPVISLKDKKELLDKIFDRARFQDEFRGFIYILITKKRFRLLREISKVYNDLVLFLEKRLNVTAYSAIELSSDNKAKLVKRLSKKFKKDINLVNSVDPSVIAGLKLKIGSLVYDMSLKKNLDSLGLALR